ncbi:MAG: HEAT repeat domain-containing protein [Verrucomicrobiota bacterium]
MLWLTLQQLKSKSEKTRLHAVEKLTALADKGETDVLDHLILALQDPVAEIRTLVARSFGSINEERLVEPLINALRDHDSVVREAAAESLKKRREPSAIPAFVNLLKDESPRVRWFAASALETMGWTPRDDVQRAWRTVALGKLEQAAELGAAAIDPLVSVLKEGVYYKRLEAVDALSRIGDVRVVKPLINALWDEDSNVRTAVVHALSKVGDTRAVDPLILALKDKDNRVRTAAVEALSRINDPRAVQPLSRLLSDGSWDVRAAVVEALGRIKDPQVLDPLVSVLRDSDSDIRHVAAVALGKLGDARAVEPLVLTLKDEQESVRQAAEAALIKIDPNWEKSEGARRVVPQLEAALKSDEYWVRNAAAAVLKRIVGEERQVNLGSAEFADRVTYKRQEAAEILMAALKDEDSDLRQAAAEALGRLGHRPATEALLSALLDTDEWVRRAAAAALETLSWQPTDTGQHALQTVILQRWVQAVSLGTAAVDPLISALTDEDSGVRYCAAEALGKIKAGRAMQPLSFLLQDQYKPVRRMAAQAIVSIGLDQATPMQRAYVAVELGDWDSAVAVGAFAVTPLVAAVRRRLEEPELASAAAAALQRINDPRAALELVGLLSDPEVAGEALVSLQFLLANRSADLEVEALRKMEKLERSVVHVYEMEETIGGYVRTGQRPLDADFVRLAAQSALAKRGLTS